MLIEKFNRVLLQRGLNKLHRQSCAHTAGRQPLHKIGNLSVTIPVLSLCVITALLDTSHYYHQQLKTHLDFDPINP